MTAPAGAGHHDGPPATTPRAIRAVLLPEEVGDFDREWRTALARAAETLDLTEVFDTLERWRRIARSTQADPQAHRRMLATAARLRAGENLPSASADDLRALINQRLGR
ncbi:hypothetical protein K1T35_20845 [Pseudonocardia sp. DSM 110487]|uniref:DUF6247 family protein n=1 Tax=Pseudonocardia sp. DSM 110487 TaxID=2865833 RepID=UPI001C69AC17|nr:DUF6247 family protein [Pseudonocardia sp. DSM 110487]QYN39430.1 hypothetical protein K1T35_20845 [Pseudonocardia sp. DSM 110487]